MRYHYMVRGAQFNCLLIAGGDQRTSGIASVVTAADIAGLQVENSSLLVAPRVPGTGHAVLLDNPDGTRATLEVFIVQRAIEP